MKIITWEDPNVVVHNVSGKPNRPPKHRNQMRTDASKAMEKEPKCQRCGYNNRKPQEKSPAWNQLILSQVWKNRTLPQSVQRRGSENKHGMVKDQYSSEESDSSNDDYQYARDLHLLHLKSLRIHEVESKTGWPKDQERWETVQIAQVKLRCQLDTGAQANVMTTKQLRNVAPNAQIKRTHKRLVSYSKHQIMPRGCAILRVKHKQKAMKVKFFIVDKAQNPILPGKACKVLNLVK